MGKLPNGEWIAWTPTILLEDNGPSVNDEGSLTANVLVDGGGEAVFQTDGDVKCANVARSFVNEDTCFLSTSTTACRGGSIDEVVIQMNKTTINVGT